MHSGAARRRRRRIVDPIHAASEKGLGDNFYSTETALFGIVSDLLEYIDEGRCTIFVLLDLEWSL